MRSCPRGLRAPARLRKAFIEIAIMKIYFQNEIIFMFLGNILEVVNTSFIKILFYFILITLFFNCNISFLSAILHVYHRTTNIPTERTYGKDIE